MGFITSSKPTMGNFSRMETYPTQEGEEGNGIEFLAMHRMMIRTLVSKFPQHAHLFKGWEAPPTDPSNANDPLPNGRQTPFDPDMLNAIDRFNNELESFDGEDIFGRFIETSLRPFPNNPSRISTDQ